MCSLPLQQLSQTLHWIRKLPAPPTVARKSDKLRATAGEFLNPSLVPARVPRYETRFEALRVGERQRLQDDQLRAYPPRVGLAPLSTSPDLMLLHRVKESARS